MVVTASPSSSSAAALDWIESVSRPYSHATEDCQEEGIPEPMTLVERNRRR